MKQFTEKLVDLKIPSSSGNEDPTTIALLERLRRILCKLCDTLPSHLKDCLIQIWIPRASHNTLLAKHSIFFAANKYSLLQYEHYSEESSKNEIPRDKKAQFLVFSNRWNYLQDELAERCGMQGSKPLPVFDEQLGPSCIAVIEIVTTRRDPDFGIEEYIQIKKQLKEEGLTTSNNVDYYFAEERGPSLVAQGLEGEPNLLGRPITSERVNSDCQFHEATQDHNRLNKDFAKSPICRKFTVGSSSTDKIPIVSARRKHPDIGNIIRIFRFKSPFTIQGLRRSIANMFNWDDNAGTNFCLYSVNNKGHRCPNSINSDEHVMELFGTCKPREPLIFIIDVVLSNELPDNGRCTYQGRSVDINEEGFKMADEAVHNELEKGDKNMRMKIITGVSVATVKDMRKKFRSSPIVINAPSTQYDFGNGKASESTVKAFPKKFCSSPIVINAPSTLQYGFGNGKAGWHKRMRTGEFISTHDIMSQMKGNEYCAIGVDKQLVFNDGNEFAASHDHIGYGDGDRIWSSAGIALPVLPLGENICPVGFGNGNGTEINATAQPEANDRVLSEGFSVSPNINGMEMDELWAILDSPHGIGNGNGTEINATAQPEANDTVLGEGFSFFRNINGMEMDNLSAIFNSPVGLDNGNGTKINATAEQQANDMLVEELPVSEQEEHAALGDKLGFASQVPQGMGNTPEQLLLSQYVELPVSANWQMDVRILSPQATAWNNGDSDDDSFMNYCNSFLISGR